LANPRSLVSALYQHWDILEWLTQLSRETPSFEEAKLLDVIARVTPTSSLADRGSVLRQLVNADILQSLPRDSAFQINPYVLEFVRSLTREHELGLSEVLRSRVAAVTRESKRVREGLQTRDTDLLRQAATKLSELFRQINQQLDQDRHAILELAERAKSADTSIPIKRRYREVLEAFDTYVAPMAEMMDSGPNGTFYRHLEEAEQTLDHAVDILTVQGALYTQRLAMRHVAYQAKELRREGREILKHCSDTLLPLREEIRQHNVLSSAVSHLIGQVRKRGLSRTLSRGELPLWKRERTRSVSVGSEVLTIMSEALAFEPVKVSFPEEESASCAPPMDLVDDAALAADLENSVPVENLLKWLYEKHGHLSDATLLRLYHDMIIRPQWTATQSVVPTTVRLHTIRVTLHGHTIHIP
jgi:hypothetical protein